MIKKIEHYFDHDADIGVIGRGQTQEAAFIDLAKHTFAIMADLTIIKPKQCIEFCFTEPDQELALVTWINLLLAKAREQGLMFSQFELKNINENWYGKACGEPWRADLEHGTEVKGATLTMLSVAKNAGIWEVKLVVDV